MSRDTAALVTGAGSGIGRATALRLARDGYAVACLDIDAARAQETAAAIGAEGGRAVASHADVADEDGVRAAMDRCEDELGSLGALVNSAGILSVAPALDLSSEAWRRVIDVNLTGSFVCAREAARRIAAASRGGRIVNVGSVHSESPGSDVVAYDASKGGVQMLTRSLARELAPQRITVNAIGPGLIQTNIVGGDNDAYIAQTIAAIPVGRIGKPEDVAGAISFLCGPEADYITGVTLFVDGGLRLTAL
jgi:NAD(P)-dependent dehydrogenase (short-subunit alcohol dehydrogenase family)